jgi:glycosyltransferase involved in cell wall biosynthesis
LLKKGVRESKIYSLPNRVDLDIFRPVGDPKEEAAFKARYLGRYRILHVGRKSEEKNLDTLIQALSILGRDYSCIFVGKGDIEPYLDQAEECGVADRCFFVESVRSSRLPEYYSFCDVMCTPSRFEGFGIVFIEAMACEAVVVTSNIAPMKEYIRHEESGLLVDAFEDPHLLAASIARATEDKALREKIKSNARKAAGPFIKQNIERLERCLYQLFLRDAAEGANRENTASRGAALNAT